MSFCRYALSSQINLVESLLCRTIQVKVYDLFCRVGQQSNDNMYAFNLHWRTFRFSCRCSKELYSSLMLQHKCFTKWGLFFVMLWRGRIKQTIQNKFVMKS